MLPQNRRPRPAGWLEVPPCADALAAGSAADRARSTQASRFAPCQTRTDMGGIPANTKPRGHHQRGMPLPPGVWFMTRQWWPARQQQQRPSGCRKQLKRRRCSQSCSPGGDRAPRSPGGSRDHSVPHYPSVYIAGPPAQKTQDPPPPPPHSAPATNLPGSRPPTCLVPAACAAHATCTGAGSPALELPHQCGRLC